MNLLVERAARELEQISGQSQDLEERSRLGAAVIRHLAEQLQVESYAGRRSGMEELMQRVAVLNIDLELAKKWDQEMFRIRNS